jgi:hypothetical protein
MLRFNLPLLVAALVLLCGVATAQTGDPLEQIRKSPGQEVTFYGHIFGWGRTPNPQPMPMNTQFPAGEADYSIGTSTRCGNPPPLPADNAACRTLGSNEQFWYSTAGFVQVKTAEQWGGDYTLFHNERGLTKDIHLDTSKTPRALYHMSADFHGWPVAACVAACWNWDPGYFQDWTVEVTIWHASLGALHANASDEPDLSEVYDRGANAYRVANGVSESIDMMSFDDTIPVVGGRTVWPFHINLTWDQDFIDRGSRIPKESSLIVEWEWYQKTENPTGGFNEYILGTGVLGIVWNINSGEDYPSHIVLPVRNPLDVELVYPQFIHGKLVILSVINTPWGSYDIDRETLKVIVRDSSGAVVRFQDGTLQEVLEQSVAHAGHYQPIKPTWVWDYAAQKLKPGDYTVTVEITNFQHSVTASTTATFTLGAGGEGTAREGRSGLQTVVGDLHAGHRGTAADPNQPVAATSSSSAPASKDSPGLALLGLLAAVGVALVLRRPGA